MKKIIISIVLGIISAYISRHLILQIYEFSYDSFLFIYLTVTFTMLFRQILFAAFNKTQLKINILLFLSTTFISTSCGWLIRIQFLPIIDLIELEYISLATIQIFSGYILFMSGQDIDDFIDEIGRVTGDGAFNNPADRNPQPVKNDSGVINHSLVPEDWGIDPDYVWPKFNKDEKNEKHIHQLCKWLEYDRLANSRKKVAITRNAGDNYETTFNSSGTSYFTDVMQYMGIDASTKVNNTMILRKSLKEAFRNK